MAMGGSDFNAPYFVKKGNAPAAKSAATAKGVVGKNAITSTSAKMSKRSTSGHQGAGAAPKAGSTKKIVKANPFAARNAMRKKGGR